ncbi:MAG: response regulator [Chloroflexi bacterium]|nr:response regulator [Chloroflexota bacterium]
MTRWLLVEDEPDIYEVLNHLNAIVGATSLIFTTGEEVADWLEAVETGEITDDLPVFALVDIRLPGRIDGVAVGERIRRCGPLRHIPIVLMTAYRLSPDKETECIRRAGANRLIYKPLPPLSEMKKMFFNLVR